MDKTKKDQIKQIEKFLDEIGIPLEKAELSEDEFLPGLKLFKGKVLYDEEKLLYPGDIIHEAGHIATTQKSERLKIGTEEMDKNWPSEGDEIATICWSYAAAKHLDFPIEALFHEMGYKNDSLWLREQFNNGTYIGLPLLEWMGLCQSEPVKSEKPYPSMLKWLRE